jgi:hypothetical protein
MYQVMGIVISNPFVGYSAMEMSRGKMFGGGTLGLMLHIGLWV